MLSVLFNVFIVLLSFLGMEAVAWFTHKYVMHGLLWYLHKDHHHKESKGFFEHNDFSF
jgi:beta-carotene 3-hydroxylase